MAVWVQNAGKIYLPPTKPVTRVISTDEYVRGTNIFYHAGTQRLLAVGHPLYTVYEEDHVKVKIPKVSGNQFRVFEILLPDPNKFALTDVYNPDKERVVWRLRGLQIDRGGPLGIGSTGHPALNRYETENIQKAAKYNGDQDNRLNTSIDPKQTQLFVVGCAPCQGEYWDISPCEQDPPAEKKECPRLQLVQKEIHDGDMCDIGFGHLNFKTLQPDRSGVPLDIVDDICVFPDFIRMASETYGDEMFFFGRREQMYARHYYTRLGKTGEEIPTNGEPANPYLIGANGNTVQHTYFVTPSGSMVTSDSQIFGRPFWLQKAQGNNNGIAWKNRLYVTVVDNTHNTNYTIAVKNDDVREELPYKSDNYTQYLRHTEEYELSMILQLCTITLEPETLAHINTMNPTILDEWNLGLVPSSVTLEDSYRYMNQSFANKCPAKEPEKDKAEAKSNFWQVDLQEKLSLELESFPLGRKFLYQTGLNKSGSLKGTKRAKTTTKSVRKKRKRTE
ncbi:L1 capsid protein [Bos taurus papillomavirus 21]|uniref:Major capsid protein L1 n=1 Tax=Bos taurus papillomavirus 21 TaxID=1887219 RepID=A0A1B2K226_9PAPI|nr:L1 capsid protein [Bos taurus papillomavirus 21]ANZ90269.1 L1 capsid protein [Bos taurus papillomavirus 21]